MKFSTCVEAVRDVLADADIPHLCFILLTLAGVGYYTRPLLGTLDIVLCFIIFTSMMSCLLYGMMDFMWTCRLYVSKHF